MVAAHTGDVKTLPTTGELVTPAATVSPSKKLVDSENVKVDVGGFGKEDRHPISECLADTGVAEVGCGRGLAYAPLTFTP